MPGHLFQISGFPLSISIIGPALFLYNFIFGMKPGVIRPAILLHTIILTDFKGEGWVYILNVMILWRRLFEEGLGAKSRVGCLIEEIWYQDSFS